MENGLRMDQMNTRSVQMARVWSVGFANDLHLQLSPKEIGFVGLIPPIEFVRSPRPFSTSHELL